MGVGPANILDIFFKDLDMLASTFGAHQAI